MGNERSSLCFYTASHSSLHSSFLALSLWIAPGRTRDQSQGRDSVNNAGSAVPRLQHLRFVAPSQQNLGASHGQEHVEGGMRSCPWARTQLETALRNISPGNISLLSQKPQNAAGAQVLLNLPQLSGPTLGFSQKDEPQANWY